MILRCIAPIGTLVATAVLLLATESIQAQGPGNSARAQTAARPWKLTRTPDGQPDLQGYWTNATFTPLERPEGVTKELYTADEIAEVRKRIAARGTAEAEEAPAKSAGEWLNSGAKPTPGTTADVHYEFTQFGLDPGQSTYDAANMRTSLIFDPKDGKIPPLSEEGKKRAADRAAVRARMGGQYDVAQNNGLAARCILFGAGNPPMLPPAYLANYQIVQAPGYVVIVSEMIHDARIIPLDGRSNTSQKIRQYLGSSRGRWEGDTLVVETTNFTDKAPFRGSTENMRVVERFTRVAEDRIVYTFTVDDPSTWTRPWSAEVPLVKTNGPLYEYACHEANYSLANQLSGARAREKKAAEEAAKTTPR